MAVATNQGHAVTMGLVDEGDDNGNYIYTLGDGSLYRWHWFLTTTTDTDHAKWRLEIKTETTRFHHEGRLKGHSVSVISRAAHAATLHEVMYLRLSILSPHASTYKQDIGTWFEGVLRDIESVGNGPIARAGALRKQGICAHRARMRFNSVLKKHWSRKSPLYSNKEKYKRELLESKLKHLQLTT